MIVRAAGLEDLPALVELYNHYVLHTAATFDVEPYTVETRRPWFEQFAATGRYRLLVAVEADRLLGYAGTMRYRPKKAYETSVECTCYVQSGLQGRGIGRALYEELFRAIASEDVHRALAGMTLPNPGSLALHQRFGFREVGRFSEQGRKHGRYWDVLWLEKPLPAAAP